MNSWNAYPFVRYVLWLILGITAALHSSFEILFGWYIVIALAIIYLSIYLARHKISWFPLMQGVIGAALLFTFGFALTKEKQEAAQIKNLPETEAYWLIEAESEATETPKTFKLEAKILGLKSEEEWERSDGKLILYIKKDTSVVLPQYGNSYILKARLVPLPDPLNPSVFNYRAYMATKGIGYQAFISAENILQTNKSQAYSLVALAASIRNRAAAIIQKWIEGRQEKAIIQTLVLGARETLDDEIKQAYATAGVMHV